MAGDKPPLADEPGGDPNIFRILWRDLVQGDFDRMFRRDLKDFYYFYLDDDRRRRLLAMSRFKQALYVLGWVARELFLRLAPARRILLVACLLVFLWGSVQVTMGDARFSLDLRIFSFAGLLFILMLELKDKLLARDELAVGRAVQLALLPDRNPELAGWSIWLYTRPANDVGGDLVDYLALPGGRLGLMLGDVAGKGLGAALLMAKLQATLRALAPEAAALDGLGGRLNAIFCRDGLPNRFATLVYLELHPGSGAVHLMNAGHLPPLVLGADGPSEMEPVAPPLGILPEAEYPEQRLVIAPGDSLVAYSDGVTDARNAAGEMFGDDRLRALLADSRGLGPADLGMRLLAEILKFAGEERLPDDLSLIILRRTGTPE
jgi:hypothetical protein